MNLSPDLTYILHPGYLVYSCKPKRKQAGHKPDRRQTGPGGKSDLPIHYLDPPIQVCLNFVNYCSLLTHYRQIQVLTNFLTPAR